MRGVRTSSSPVRPGSEGPLAWTRGDLLAQRGWRTSAGLGVQRDLARLERWVSDAELRGEVDPVGAYCPGILVLPGLHDLARRIRWAVDHGPGLAVLRGLDHGASDAALRLVHLEVAAALGPEVGSYGRLFEVRDRGVDARTQAVPVSMTRAATGFHTDSSAREVWPRAVGLMCLQAAEAGGDSRVACVGTVVEHLQATAPEALEILERPFLRDVVTPGAQRDLSNLRANRFPILERGRGGRGVRLRWMRLWIERGHERSGEPLDPAQRAALDALEQALECPKHHVTLRLERGDALWVHNGATAHDRTAFQDDPLRPRRLMRAWVGARREAAAA